MNSLSESLKTQRMLKRLQDAQITGRFIQYDRKPLPTVYGTNDTIEPDGLCLRFTEDGDVTR